MQCINMHQNLGNKKPPDLSIRGLVAAVCCYAVFAAACNSADLLAMVSITACAFMNV